MLLTSWMWASWYHNSRMNANTVHCTIKGVKYPIGVRLWCGLSLRCCTKDDGFCSDWFQTLVAVRWGAFMGSLSLRATPRPQLIIGEDRMRALPHLTTSLYNVNALTQISTVFCVHTENSEVNILLATKKSQATSHHSLSLGRKGCGCYYGPSFTK